MPPIPRLAFRRISLDTETTGVDLHHGAKPFLVTICREWNSQLIWWEWDVDPLTREPIIPPEDIVEIQAEIDAADEIVLQNPKFDATALATIDVQLTCWEKIRDTLLAGHLLASNFPHDLTSMALQFCGKNIEPLERRMEAAVKAARSIIQRKANHEKYGAWRIASAGLPEMPSAKEKVWKFDMWLPRAVAKAEGFAPDHDWFRVTPDYANGDSGITLPVYAAQRRLIAQRKLDKIYEFRLRLPRVVSAMENRGVTLSGARLDELDTKFGTEADKAADTCVGIAASYGYDLKMPRSGSNGSLSKFCFGEPLEGDSPLFPNRKQWLDLPIVGRTDTGNPSFDKDARAIYLDTLPGKSLQGIFVKAFSTRQSYVTAQTYMRSYRRFWIPVGPIDPETGAGWYVLHPSLNPTGTSTLRWSCSNPNEQNISKKKEANIRYCFGPAPGREWWSIDAQNIELRIPAYESGEQELIELFERPNDPPYYGSNHILIFHTLHPDKWDIGLREVGFNKVASWCKETYESTWYQWTKNGNFAVQYGAVDKDDGDGTADRAYHVKGAQSRIKQRFQKLEALNQKYIAFANKYGYVETIPDKTVDPERGYPILCTRTERGRIKPTVPFNYHVQSTAMQWMAKAMVRSQEYLDSLNRRLPEPDYFMIMQVHDELVFDFPRGTGAEPWKTNRPHITEIMRLMAMGGSDIGLPTPVSVKYHPDNWSVGLAV